MKYLLSIAILSCLCFGQQPQNIVEGGIINVLIKYPPVGDCRAQYYNQVFVQSSGDSYWCNPTDTTGKWHLITGAAGPAGPTGPSGLGVNVTPYNFTSQTPGGSITASTPATVTLTPCPLGVNGSNSSHYLYISAGSGTAESVLITGGTCTSGGDSGTITFTPSNDHSGAWTIKSATAGGQEAAFANPNTGISFSSGNNAFYATLTLNPPTTANAILCPSLGSVIQTQSATADIIHLYSSNPSSVIGCTITSAVTRTGGVGIVLGDGITDNCIGSHIDNNQILLQYQVVHVKSGNNWVMTGNLVTASNVDLWIENLVNGDQGDFSITSNGFQMFGSPTSVIKWNSAGGMKFIGNKIVAVLPTAMDLSCNQSACTGDILIANNSIEGFTSTGINLSVSNTSGNIGLIQIENNQLGGAATSYAIVAAGAGANVVEQLIISGNISESCKFINLGANVEYVIVSNNQANTPTVFSTMTSPTATFLNIKDNMVLGYSPGDANIYGNYANMLLSHQDRGYIAVANLPSAVLDTSTVMTASTGTSTCVAGAILTLAHRINGAWNCAY